MRVTHTLKVTPRRTGRRFDSVLALGPKILVTNTAINQQDTPTINHAIRTQV